VNGETMNLNDLPEQYRKQAREKYEKAYNRNTSSATNKKRIIRHEQMEAKTVTRFNRPVSITMRTTRRRDTDRHAVEDKYFTDSLVTCKVLRNDTKKDIAKLDIREPEIGKDEKTIIEIEEV